MKFLIPSLMTLFITSAFAQSDLMLHERLLGVSECEQKGTSKVIKLNLHQLISSEEFETNKKGHYNYIGYTYAKEVLLTKEIVITENQEKNLNISCEEIRNQLANLKNKTTEIIQGIDCEIVAEAKNAIIQDFNITRYKQVIYAPTPLFIDGTPIEQAKDLKFDILDGGKFLANVESLPMYAAEKEDVPKVKNACQKLRRSILKILN